MVDNSKTNNDKWLKKAAKGGLVKKTVFVPISQADNLLAIAARMRKQSLKDK